MPSFATSHCHFTVPQLYRYFGFCQLKNWSSILDIAQDNISLCLNHGEIPVESGNVANLKKRHRNKTSVPRPQIFLIVYTWVLVMVIARRLEVASIVSC
jgi:hypothetical protein